MAESAWVGVEAIWCERVEAQATLLEERVYAPEVLPEGGPAYHVRARKCSFGVECNLAGYKCQYAMNNPNYDPFA